MTITEKNIIIDTNIITDLSNAKILDRFVTLDNVYICDMVKNDEINDYTGNKNTIEKLKTIHATSEQIKEIFQISQKGLSPYDKINYIIARDNHAILATGDKKLKNFFEKNGVEVIRTLKIIQYMKEKNILSIEEAIQACVLLNNHNCTRIPTEIINDWIEKWKNEKNVSIP